VGTDRVVIVGAGIGGLTAAVELAARGLDVTVLERAGGPGGKMREIAVGDRLIDAGPTVFTMRWVFEAVCEAAGTSLESEVDLEQAEVLARHAWSADERLDLFADLERSADAVAAFSGPAERQRFLAFSEDARAIYRTLKEPFISATRPSPVGLVRRVGPGGLGGLINIKPFATMWSALGEHFRDSRLRQLFGRYATYCGSSPYAAPATLMLVAHVEQDGVWLVKGGMHQLAQSFAASRSGLAPVFDTTRRSTRSSSSGAASKASDSPTASTSRPMPSSSTATRMPSPPAFSANNSGVPSHRRPPAIARSLQSPGILSPRQTVFR
jgi:1-hydroxycarotenoid 3,4-desaturase